MTLHKHFIQTFSPLLEANGFIRRRNGFYRLYNNEMLQGIVLKSTNPYMVCYTSFPYWCYDYINKYIGIRDLNKNYWMEDIHINSYNGELLLTYYDKDNPERNERDMNIWLEITKEIILPYLNQMSNTTAYMDSVISTLKATGDTRGTRAIINEYLLLYKAYIDGDFDYAKSYLKLYYNATINDTRLPRPNTPKAIKEDAERVFNIHFSIITQKIEENDVNWIAPIYAQKEKEMRQSMRECLGIKIEDI